jgi:hypothetical protein
MVVVVPYLQLVGIRQISPSLLVAGAKIHTKLILSSLLGEGADNN